MGGVTMKTDPQVHRVKVKRVPGTNTPAQGPQQQAQANMHSMWQDILTRKHEQGRRAAPMGD